MAFEADTAPPLVLVGASVRALAESARRAGWDVHAADLFHDADLRAVATAAVRVPTGPDCPWPAALEACVRGFPVAPWIYSGALENHPDLVDRLAVGRPLAGNAGGSLRAVRDPAVLADRLRAAGVPFPETRCTGAAVPADGSFLVKPRASAGGRGVARWHGGGAAAGRLWQRFVPGRPWSASFVIDAAGPRLFGVSRQLVGRTWCGARGFAWCGAVDVPVAALAASMREPLERLGAVLAGAFGLVGLVGADLVVDPAGVPHVVEINPRPTASMELVERATGASVVATHLAACGFAPPPAATGPPTAAWAKAVVFADRATAFGPACAAALGRLAAPWSGADGWPAVADVPGSDTTIEAGRPALTVFAGARDAVGAMRLLRHRVAAVRRVLRGAEVSPPAGAAAGLPPPAPGSSA